MFPNISFPLFQVISNIWLSIYWICDVVRDRAAGEEQEKVDCLLHDDGRVQYRSQYTEARNNFLWSFFSD